MTTTTPTHELKRLQQVAAERAQLPGIARSEHEKFAAAAASARQDLETFRASGATNKAEERRLVQTLEDAEAETAIPLDDRVKAAEAAARGASDDVERFVLANRDALGRMLAARSVAVADALKMAIASLRELASEYAAVDRDWRLFEQLLPEKHDTFVSTPPSLGEFISAANAVVSHGVFPPIPRWAAERHWDRRTGEAQ